MLKPSKGEREREREGERERERGKEFTLKYLCQISLYCEQTLSEEQHLLKYIYLMMPVVRINLILYKTEA